MVSRAETYHNIVVDSLNDMGEALEAIHREKLYRDLGYKSFNAYLRSVQLPSTNAYRYIKMYIAERELTQIGTELSLKQSQLDALYGVDPEYRHVVIDASLAVTDILGDKLTASRIKRVSANIDEAVSIGAVDIGDGLSTPLVAAVVKSESEAIARQAQHVRDKGKRVYHVRGEAARVFGRTLQFNSQLELSDGQQVFVSFWTEDEMEAVR